MAVYLVVTSPFAANSEGIARAYAVGDTITDAAEVERLADSPFVVRLAPPPAPPPTEEELQERAEALAALQRLDAKLRSSAASSEGTARPSELQQQEG